MGDVIWGTDFKARTRLNEALHLLELGEKILAEALDCAAPDIWAGKHYPGGIDDIQFDEGA